MIPAGSGGSICEECAEKARRRERRRDYKKEYESRSDDPKYRRFYRSKQWRMTSRLYAQQAGYRCEECGDIGTDVHHISPIQTEDGWSRRFDFSNLRLLCVRCHNDAHGRTFRNGWGENGGEQQLGQAEEAPLDAHGGHVEGGPCEAGGGGGVLKVSDYRV